MTIERVSTASRYDSTIASLQDRQRAMSKAQQQMSSGKRISRPSDDPTGAARAERAVIAQSRIDSAERSVKISQNSMTMAEAALGDAGDLMQSAREIMVQAGNGTYSPGERTVLAGQLRNLRTQLLSVANTTDGAGGFVFGGQGSPGAPFVDGVTGVSFIGTPGDAQLSNTDQLPLALDGQNIWLTAPGGVNVFDTLDQAINSLTDPAATNASISQAVKDGLNRLDDVMVSMQSARSVAGNSIKRLESMTSLNVDRTNWAKGVQSDAEDLDMVEAISNFQNEQSSYQAALQTYSMVQRLSLFDYIK